MLLADGRALRVVADPSRQHGIGRLYRGIAIGATIVAGWAALWFGALLVLGLARTPLLGIEPFPLLVLGAVGLLCAAVVGGLAWWAWYVVREIRRRFPVGSTVIAVSAAGIETAETGPVGFDAITGAAIRWEAVRHAPPMNAGGAIGQRIGRAAARRAGLDTHRAVLLQLADGRAVEAVIGPFATEHEFARVVEALSHELGRRGVRLDDARVS